MRALFDTDILIDALQGIPRAFEELERYEECLVSRITWIEILVGADSGSKLEAFRDYLKKFSVRELDGPVAARAVALRRRYKLKIPDAIIWATAEEEGCLLVTRNARHFPPDHPGIRVPYKL
ncbi:MAG: PIN domain-containing protein [Acidobacteria bacterium]|nr:PIN domain-containing protein [Acidobacteriota bacterium]